MAVLRAIPKNYLYPCFAGSKVSLLHPRQRHKITKSTNHHQPRRRCLLLQRQQRQRQHLLTFIITIAIIVVIIQHLTSSSPLASPTFVDAGRSPSHFVRCLSTKTSVFSDTDADVASTLSSPCLCRWLARRALCAVWLEHSQNQFRRLCSPRLTPVWLEQSRLSFRLRALWPSSRSLARPCGRC